MRPAISPAQPTEHGPLRLEYASRLPPRWPKLVELWRRLRDLGPLFPWPSLVTVGLLLACLGAMFLLSLREEPWRLVRSQGIGQYNGHPNSCYLRSLDAVASPNSSGGLRIWRPWTGDVLMNTEVPPIELPPNPPPGRKGELWWVIASADESKLIARSDQLGDFIWDARTGRFLAHLAPYLGPGAAKQSDLPTYLGPEAAKQSYFCLGALSPDGSRLCVVNDKNELLLYDITGPSGKLLARRALNPPQWPNRDGTEVDPRIDVRFAPDGRTVVVAADLMLWIGNAATLDTRVSLLPAYCTPGDVAFLRGGAQFLALVRAEGNDQLRLYDSASGQVLRTWQLPGEPSAISVSNDEARVLIAMPYQASLLLELSDTNEAVARRGYTRRIPAEAWLNRPAPFFPDNRRAIVTPENTWNEEPVMIDTVTGRQLARLHPPRGSFLGQDILPSQDGKQFAVADKFNLHVYQQVGPESAWGVLVAWQFWLLALCVAGLVVSLCRDAGRTRRRWGGLTPLAKQRHALAIALVLVGGVALMALFVRLSMQRGYVWWGPDVLLNQLTRWWLRDGWLATVFAFYLFAGLGVMMGSRAWTFLLALALAGSTFLALWLAWNVGEIAQHPHRIFDRACVFSRTSLAVGQVGWAILSLVGLAALLIRRGGALSTIVTNDLKEQP